MKSRIFSSSAKVFMVAAAVVGFVGGLILSAPGVLADTFTAPTISATLNYNGTAKTINLGGTVTDGTDAFTTTCPYNSSGNTRYTENDTQGDGVSSSSWTITNSSGRVVMSGNSGFYGILPNSPTKYYTVCAGSYGQAQVSDGSSGTWAITPESALDVSSLASDNYTFNLTVIGTWYNSGPGPTVTWNSTFTVSPINGTITVNADRTAYWEVTGANTEASLSGSGASGGPYTAPADRYTMVDPATESSPYGFIDNPTYSLIGTPNIFVSLVRTAEASSCGGWTCDLSVGSTVSYHLTTTTCNISLETNVDGNISNMSSLPMIFSGPLNSYSYTSTPQTPYSIADSSGSTFTLTLPSTGTWSNYTTDYIGTDVTSSDGTVTSYPSTTLSPNPACVAGGSLTFVAKYLTRAVLLVK